MQDLNEEAFEVSTTLWIQSVFQGNIVFLQVHVLHCLQVDLWVNNMTLRSPQNPFSLLIFVFELDVYCGPKILLEHISRPTFGFGNLESIWFIKHHD